VEVGEGKVAFGPITNQAIFLVLGDAKARVDGDAVVQSMINDSIGISLTILNGYSNGVFVSRQQEVVFGGGSTIKALDKHGRQLLMKPLTSQIGPAVIDEEQFAYLTPPLRARGSGEPQVTPHGVTKLSWSQRFLFTAEASPRKNELVLPRYAGEIFELPADTDRVEVLLPVTINYFLLGDATRYGKTVNFKITGLRFPSGHRKEISK
jgi:hypothetical protein